MMVLVGLFVGFYIFAIIFYYGFVYKAMVPLVENQPPPSDFNELLNDNTMRKVYSTKI